MSTKPTFHRAVETDLLVDLFRRHKGMVGKVLTYAEMSRLIARDVQHGGRGVLRTARKVAEREFGVVFGVVLNVGLEVLSEAGKVEAASTVVGRVHRAARSAVKTLQAVEIAKLSDAEKMKFNHAASHAAMLEAMTTARTSKRLEIAVERSRQTLPLGQMLELFQDRTEARHDTATQDGR